MSIYPFKCFVVEDSFKQDGTQSYSYHRSLTILRVLRDHKKNNHTTDLLLVKQNFNSLIQHVNIYIYINIFIYTFLQLIIGFIKFQKTE